jgi:hypothetical protein
MNLLSYIIWNGSPEIFTIPIPFLDTQITLRWYGLLFALGIPGQPADTLLHLQERRKA